MTDSMKFGPEWLRNLSTDSTTSTSIGGGGVGGSGYLSSNSNSIQSSISIGGGSNNFHHGNSSSTAQFSGQRNMFPQFRYGREELLSLFDKSCNMPEILPGYKQLFVEKVQVPLALTPSNDEEVFPQVPSAPAQRPAWIRRSPVGFSPAIRGTGRGGSVDRGRMRGKSVYHPIYQRPTPMFEDDIRPASLKPERGWSERNGAGDTLGSGGPSVGGSVSADWNGTPASSPRKEFSSHSRNMENWRKNRTEDGSGDASTSGLVGTDGWRGSSSFGSTHRWGRSTSWRDDDTAAATANTESYSGSGIAMQRSYSTISTTVTDRGGYGGSTISKSSSLTSTSGYVSGGNQANNRQISSGSASGRNSQWVTSSGDTDDNLPEWAMENPSDSGGTFDATGAFHGSIDDDDTITGSKDFQYSQKKKNSSSYSKANCKDDNDQEQVETTNSTIMETDSSPITQHDEELEILVEPENLPGEKKEIEHLLEEKDVESDKTNDSSSSCDENVTGSVLLCNDGTKKTTEPDSKTKSSKQKVIQTTNSNSDLSDRMQEVADDMVEKLIMDDDSVGINNNGNKTPKTSNSSVAQGGINMPNPFVAPAVAAILKQTAAQQQVSQNIAASPSLPDLGSHKVMPLFGGGIVVDHATMQQHHLQQQQLAAASAAASLQSTINSASTVDLWYYRDPQSKVQGPFTAIEMAEWYRAGYFDENLYVRRVCDTRFRALGELIKLCHGNMPFTHTHLIPMGLDNVKMVPNAVSIRQVRDKLQVMNDFGLNQIQEQREELKGNVTAAADSLSAAVKNLINPVDMSHMMNLHFQMLQEQYLRHQEMLVVAEFSNKDGFQRLTPSERENVVRQKVQMLGLPEYLTSLAGLSNSLATLNPTAGNQLYDVIAECSKKEQHFASGPQAQAQSQQQHQPQQAITNPFLDPDDFILNAQKQQQTQFANVPFRSVVNAEKGSVGNVGANDDMTTNELINDFNLRMLLRGGNINSQQGSQQKTATEYGAASSSDFISQQQLMAAATQSPALQMWIPQMGGTNNVQQPQFMVQQPQQANNQWNSGTIVNLPNSSGTAMGGIDQSKNMPASMWDVLPVEQVHNQHQFQQNILNFEVQAQQKATQPQHTNTTQDHGIVLAQDDEESFSELSPPSTQQQEITDKTISLAQQELSSTKLRKEDQCEKQQLQHTSSVRRVTNKQQSSNSKVREETTKKQTEEDRRREQAEEKRRLKDEKKRQQAEEEKRRLQQIEDEKRRQILEEKERQQQIQAQRRKAMLGNAAANAAVTATTSLNSIKLNRDQQRVQSSIAPWSAQTTGVVSTSGPSLVEIQKAERRERRADQQRQMEILEKQLIANKAAADTNESFLKWNASPVPVKSFAEIQAEESKRLASEQLETQRRKELEQASAIVANIGAGAIGVGVGVSSTNLSAIWSGSKVWGSTSNAGFWEEPIKFSAALAANNNNTVAAPPAVPTASITVKPQPSPSQQQKLQIASSQPSVLSSNRNLTKSQTVSIMQNSTVSLSGSSNKSNLQNNSTVAIKQVQKQQPQQLKPISSVEKKGSVKNHLSAPNNVATNSNKKDDFQNEFTGWCMKILNGMNAKVDVPTFVTFLQDLESPYEVKDYVRMYLGESKEYTEFAKQFLERRSKYKNMQRAQNAHNDDMCKPAPAITPSGNDYLDNKGKQKKIKKSKMTKLDARILGFSVTAAEGRINVGDRDYVDAP